MSLVLKKKRKTYDIIYKKDDIEATFKCCVLNTREVNNLIKKNRPITWDSPDNDTPKERFVESIDQFGFSIDSFCETIISWEGINKEDGTPQECNKEAKIILYDNYSEIGNYITNEIKKIRDDLKLEAEKLEKNLSSTADMKV